MNCANGRIARHRKKTAALQTERGGLFRIRRTDYFIIAAATFLNAAMSAFMCSSV